VNVPVVLPAELGVSDQETVGAGAPFNPVVPVEPPRVDVSTPAAGLDQYPETYPEGLANCSAVGVSEV
jgi:hypothetical protein